MLINRKLILLAIVAFAFSVPSFGQFVKKYQWDISFVVSETASKPIPTPDGSLFDVGNGHIAGANTAFWYNLNRKVSIGINGGILSNFPSFDNVNDDDVTKNIRYTGFSVGLSGKYNFFDKKRIKAFAMVSANQFFNELRTPTYFRIYDPGDTESYTYHYHGRKVSFQNSLGGSLGVGATAYLSKSFGLTISTGYQNNNYYKGPWGNLGFSFSFVNN